MIKIYVTDENISVLKNLNEMFENIDNAKSANDLRGYLIAKVEMLSINKAIRMQIHKNQCKLSGQHYMFTEQPFFYQIDTADFIDDIMSIYDFLIRESVIFGN